MELELLDAEEVGRQSGNKWERKRWMLRESHGEEVRVRTKSFEARCRKFLFVECSRSRIASLLDTVANETAKGVWLPFPEATSNLKFQLARKKYGGSHRDQSSVFDRTKQPKLSHAPLFSKPDSSTFSIAYSSLIEFVNETVR